MGRSLPNPACRQYLIFRPPTCQRRVLQWRIRRLPPICPAVRPRNAPPPPRTSRLRSVPGPLVLSPATHAQRSFRDCLISDHTSEYIRMTGHSHVKLAGRDLHVSPTSRGTKHHILRARSSHAAENWRTDGHGAAGRVLLEPMVWPDISKAMLGSSAWR
jgi:hypothetical protein